MGEVDPDVSFSSYEVASPDVRLKMHVYVTTTYKTPTSCADCNHMLLGLSGQGKQCSHCYRVVCHTCSAANVDGCAADFCEFTKPLNLLFGANGKLDRLYGQHHIF